MTLDTDVAVPKNLLVDQQNIVKRLHEHGFTESFLGDHQPPVTQYRLGSEHGDFYVEFLTPLQGSGYTREGEPDTTVRIGGVSSQKLRYLDVLLRDPWDVSIKADEASFSVKVANPTAFIVQKLLICGMRLDCANTKMLMTITKRQERKSGKRDAMPSSRTRMNYFYRGPILREKPGVWGRR